MRRLLFILLSISTVSTQAKESSLWGKNGEKYDPQGRLPDFSHAGYESGNPIPSSFKNHKQTNVTDFGAKPNDKIDDTQAFVKAIASVKGPTVVNIPAGKFIITNRLHLKTANTILRGTAQNKTTLYFPKGLETIDPKPTQNSGGTPTSSYSWSGGFINITGKVSHKIIPTVSATAKRGTTQLKLKSTDTLKPGMPIQITQRSKADNALLNHLYSNDPGDTSNIKPNTNYETHTRIKNITANTLTLDRPLLSDINPDWITRVSTPTHSVHHTGIQNLTIEFPPHAYGGHFREVGYNAINISNTTHCWAQNITISNSDSGIFCNSIHTTLKNITLKAPAIKPTESRAPHINGSTGHHGITLNGQYNL